LEAEMARKRYTTEEIIRKLWEADVLLGQGQAVALSRQSWAWIIAWSRLARAL